MAGAQDPSEEVKWLICTYTKGHKGCPGTKEGAPEILFDLYFPVLPGFAICVGCWVPGCSHS